MKDFNINPQNVIGGRRLECLLPHIEPVFLDHLGFNNRHKLSEWIEGNLNGRYYIGFINRLFDNRIITQEIVGFEDPYESTIFLLKCPYLAKNKL